MTSDAHFILSFDPGKGLHFRVADRLIRTAQRHHVELSLGRGDGIVADQHSIVGIMLLKISGNETGRLRLVGHRAAIDQCVAEIKAFLPAVEPVKDEPENTHNNLRNPNKTS